MTLKERCSYTGGYDEGVGGRGREGEREGQLVGANFKMIYLWLWFKLGRGVL